jgi:hypothetical protein
MLYCFNDIVITGKERTFELKEVVQIVRGYGQDSE